MTGISICDTITGCPTKRQPFLSSKNSFLDVKGGRKIKGCGGK